MSPSSSTSRLAICYGKFTYAIGANPLAGGVGRITGTVILGVVTSGFTFLKVGAYYQKIVKGLIIIAAVVIDQHRQNKRRKT